jgi:uncharacterized protein YjbI with pentapeptide repeats
MDADLSGADLSEAFLGGTQLIRTDLRSATLTAAESMACRCGT